MTQAHLGGAAQPSPAQPADDDYNQITSRLSRGVTDWAVTDGDVQAVHQQLDGLSNTEYKATMDRLEQDGYLSTYTANMNSSARDAFLEQAANKGYIQTQAGREYNVSGTQPKPPNSPDLYRHSEDLPSSVREAIHDGNVERFHNYREDYKTYINDYKDQVMATSSQDEIRAMGAPVNSFDGMEPGLSPNDPMRARWTHEAISGSPSHLPAYAAIGNKIRDLDGEVRPGSFYASGEVSWQQSDNGSDYPQFGGKIGGRVYDYGAVEVEAMGSASGILDTPLAGEAGVQGIRTPGPGGVTHFQAAGEAKIEGEFEYNESTLDRVTSTADEIVQAGDNEKSALDRVIPMTVEVDQTGKVELGVEAIAIDTPHGELGVSSYASSDPSNTTFEMGIAGEIGVGKGDVQVKGGVGFRGITSDEIVEAMNNPGIFED